MNSDPAEAAARRVLACLPAIDFGPREWRELLAQAVVEIREAYAPTLAAKDAEVAGWLRTSQVQDERIDELRAERERLAAEGERLKTVIRRIQEAAMIEHVKKEIGP